MKFSFQTVILSFFVTLVHIVIIIAISPVTDSNQIEGIKGTEVNKATEGQGEEQVNSREDGGDVIEQGATVSEIREASQEKLTLAGRDVSLADEKGSVTPEGVSAVSLDFSLEREARESEEEANETSLPVRVEKPTATDGPHQVREIQPVPRA